MLRVGCARSFAHAKVAIPSTRIACKRFSSSTGNTITPKDEYSGRSAYEIGNKAKERVHPSASPLHRVHEPVGEEDAPWTPKSFIGKTPQQLVHEVPPIPVNGARVSCNGGPNRAMGHPEVYLNLDGEKPKPCPYCGLRYFNAKKSHH
ncbi:hypothetical protein GUITHDRAFT_165716 [Guillardia theta CCMP2712]|uniref:Zinc finger CHCC-type domain-containing protein n=2 Tax=Guillardia theta TaxID=55529 RepID=L1IJT8_GUITC|nr:hypothetical protein GUITHDRAFT_165716 [Guillardia theta CCMP2712]EKX36513.1 hypothetical protein GUITHDRAFT_165716 [Guillardia theta CCMP2712]|eukprot:XP_005823493.1 hypothetical protein GUITHDRAFT_165716 [Guillardia theta CCMP2712]